MNSSGDIPSLTVQLPGDLDSITILRRFEKLTSFYGAGRKLTATGQPTVADAKTLVELLDLDDEIDPKIGQRILLTRSASELRDLSLTLNWAVRSGALRKVHGRFAATKTWTKASPAKRFTRSADALIDTGPMTMRHGPDRRGDDILTLVDDDMPALLVRLAEGPLDIVEATEEFCAYLENRYLFSDWLAEPDARRRTFGRHLDGAARMLALAGLATFDAPPPARWHKSDRPLGGTLELSAAGQWWLSQTQLSPASSFRYRPAPPRSTTAHRLRVSLDRIEPEIWREVVVPSGFSLGELHTVIQLAMGWADCHLHDFHIDGQRYTELSDFDDDWGQPGVDENVARLTDVAGPRKRFSYEYDFGDSWHHMIKVVSVAPIGDGPDAEIPVCTGGARACPPEDVGGIWGYARSLEAAADPEDDEHDSYMGWLGEDFDPECVDIAAVNAALEARFSERAKKLAKEHRTQLPP
ncbi:MAG: plasmid pRiA4b ORF-3 family protein [Acidimicrobiales bacterium]